STSLADHALAQAFTVSTTSAPLGFAAAFSAGFSGAGLAGSGAATEAVTGGLAGSLGAADGAGAGAGAGVGAGAEATPGGLPAAATTVGDAPPTKSRTRASLFLAAAFAESICSALS